MRRWKPVMVQRTLDDRRHETEDHVELVAKDIKD